MLDIKLKDYADSNIYPFHMPGHKRQLKLSRDPYEVDITEIEGFDNLHHARECLLEAQMRAAKLYGSKKAYYLVNGSTCGILASICAATRKGDKVLVARNCHKAVYHGIELNELVPTYIYPEITSQGIQGQILVKDIEMSLKTEKDIRAVILTSPTYDGVVSDIQSIAELVHSYDIPLIVDEAHGAHFGMEESLPENAIQLGADLVILSVHKTLPAFTQTALLHVCSDRISCQKVEKYLDIFETSSPSYILMAGIERCIRLLTERGKEMFSDYMERLYFFYQRMEELKCLRVVRKQHFSDQEAYDFDETKILIFTDSSGIDGKTLHDILLQEYQIELEMVTGSYVLALSTVMDTQEGFDRLSKALLEIDERLWTSLEKGNTKEILGPEIYRRMDRRLEIHELAGLETETISLKKAEGRIAATYVYLYPPGIPLILPGEEITQQLIWDIERAIESRLEVDGLTKGVGIDVVNQTSMLYTKNKREKI